MDVLVASPDKVGDCVAFSLGIGFSDVEVTGQAVGGDVLMNMPNAEEGLYQFEVSRIKLLKMIIVDDQKTRPFCNLPQ